MEIDEINFAADDFSDVVAKDPRYNSRAYALLCDVISYLSEKGKRHVGGEQILEEFKERTLDQYGPLSYTVLSEWGLAATEDIGEMLFNLADSGRIGRDDGDSRETFVGGYDFKATFLEPYQA